MIHPRFPFINIDCWLDESQSNVAKQSERVEVAKTLVTAARDHGLVYVRSSLLPLELQHNMRELALEFFHSPMKEKQALEYKNIFENRGYHCQIGNPIDVKKGKKPDIVEVFSLGKETDPDELRRDYYNLASTPKINWVDLRNKWPSTPQFRETSLKFFESGNKVVCVLLKALAVGLELPVDYFTASHNKQDSVLNFKLYKPMGSKEEKQCRIEPHTDFGSLTLVSQDQVGGLQVFLKGEGWTDIVPVEDYVVIHFGDQFEIWTNELCKSTLHRVMVTHNSTASERCSVILFCSPNWETELAPPPQLGAAKHPPIVVGDHVLARLKELSTGFST